MLERLLIKNFQTHEKLDVTFDPGITVIVGRTDSGKSSVIRALKWALINQPRGSAFTKHGENTVGVKVKIDGKTITRSKEGNDNHYSIGDSDYTAFGAAVPEPISNFLKVDELNFQQQHDAPFWLSLSSGEVSRRLNEIVDLSIIDKATSEIKSLLLDQKRQVESNLSKLKSEQEKLATFDWVDEANSDLNGITSLEDEIHKSVFTYEKLRTQTTQTLGVTVSISRDTDILAGLRRLGSKLSSYETLQDRSAKLEKKYDECLKTSVKANQTPINIGEIDNSYRKIEILSRTVVKLRDLLTTINQYRQTANEEITFPNLDSTIQSSRTQTTRIERLETVLSSLRKIETPEPLDLSIINAAYQKFHKLELKKLPLAHGVSQLKILATEIERATKTRDLTEKEIVDKTEGQCPICGGVL